MKEDLKTEVNMKNTGVSKATAQAIKEDVCERLNCKGHLILTSSCHIIWIQNDTNDKQDNKRKVKETMILENYHNMSISSVCI